MTEIRFPLPARFSAILLVAALLWLFPLAGASEAQDPSDSDDQQKPNIVFVLCDDLGYGDVHCLAPKTSKIATPSADALARQGVIFTDAHSGSSVCTPTRYGLLTGRYAWRTRLQKGVATGFAPSLIDKDRPTLGSFLQQQGYHTAIVGKWHLDFQYLKPQTEVAYKRKDHKLPPVGAMIPDGPIHRGFDSFLGFHHAREMKSVIRDDKVIAHDKVDSMLPRLTKAACDYVASRKESKQPFFLYVPLGSPHTPIVPTGEWKGKSGLGDYADFVMQTDHTLGRICATLQSNGLDDNTIVVFASDNGCSRAANIKNLAQQGHVVSGPFRGSKADTWEGGHRIPFIVRWPGKVQPATKNNTTICLTDVFATVADIVSADLPNGSCEDSISFLSSLVETDAPVHQASRAGIVHHSVSGHFSYRMGPWKLILARGSGGWSAPRENQLKNADVPIAQLYNLSNDIGEQDNLYDSRRDVADRLLRQLELDVKNGSSVTGRFPDGENPSGNDIDKIELWKSK